MDIINKNNDESHNTFDRKSPRAKFHDYSGGDYFVTICTADKQHYFGHINSGEMHFSKIGLCAQEALAAIPSHYNYVEVPLFVVMPNHIHAIIAISESLSIPKQREALGVVIGGFKQAVTRFARRNNLEFDWQKRYHDHIIRNINDGNNIAKYIEDNVAKWDSDCFHH
jgi:REP element-mobilizing transposase RayT